MESKKNNIQRFSGVFLTICQEKGVIHFLTFSKLVIAIPPLFETPSRKWLSQLEWNVEERKLRALRGERWGTREKLIALQETHGVTTAETSTFLLGHRTCVARRWLSGWCCHAWMLLPAMLRRAEGQGFNTVFKQRLWRGEKGGNMWVLRD